MRALERFLVVLAFLSLLMRIFGLKDAPTLELIAISALALFYVIAFPFLLLSTADRIIKKSWKPWTLAFLTGLALAYCLISLLCYTLNWIKASDMLVNGSLICAALIGGALWGRKRQQPFWTELCWRALILWVVIIVIGVWKLPALGALSHGMVK
jgi:hypothetical protein